jgi:hypothetical protein
MVPRKGFLRAVLLSGTSALLALPAGSQDITNAFGLIDRPLAPARPAIATRPTLNFYGVTGLIDMPTGEDQPDGQFSATVSSFAGITRGTLTFQAFPFLSGSFRYSGIQDWDFDGFSTFYDRSFDVRLWLLREQSYLPSVVVGLQDFAGTGISAAEYVVATKHILPNLKVTGGLGWGRFGSKGDIGSPFGSRPDGFSALGGKFETDRWFRGPMAFFGGVEWQPTDRLGLKVEYSSDDYDVEAGRQLRTGAGEIFDRKSSWNFGAEYQVNDQTRLGAYYLYGSEVGLTLQFSTDPATRPRDVPQAGPGPLPVQPRPERATDPDAWSTEWTEQPDAATILRGNVARSLMRDGMTLQGMALSADRVRIRLGNNRYDAEAQAVGRAARILTRLMPASIEIFEIVPVVDGIPLSMVTFRRSDLEALEHAPDGAARLLARTKIGEALSLGAPQLAPGPETPRLNWTFLPYVRQSFFDPDNPLRLGFGLKGTARYELARGLFLSGSLAQQLAGDIDKVSRQANSRLPAVRTDEPRFNREGDPAIEELTAAYYTRPGENLYGRVTVGYLERMYGGVSGEVLWKPVESPLALGVEVNYVKKRDFDQLFDFRSYDVVTGHVSAYYNFGKGYVGQVDVGRYLAKDYGTTLTLEREFANGWKFAAFATFTDVSAEEFGEGSFDKGIRIEIPISWITGRDTRQKIGTTLRPVLRDGGARLNVDGRLYDTVRDYDANGLDSQWGRVWR